MSNKRKRNDEEEAVATPSPASHLESLPPELLLAILERAPPIRPSDLLRVAQTSRYMRSFVFDEQWGPIARRHLEPYSATAPNPRMTLLVTLATYNSARIINQQAPPAPFGVVVQHDGRDVLLLELAIVHRCPGYIVGILVNRADRAAHRLGDAWRPPYRNSKHTFGRVLASLVKNDIELLARWPHVAKIMSYALLHYHYAVTYLPKRFAYLTFARACTFDEATSNDCLSPWHRKAVRPRISLDLVDAIFANTSRIDTEIPGHTGIRAGSPISLEALWIEHSAIPDRRVVDLFLKHYHPSLYTTSSKELLTSLLRRLAPDGITTDDARAFVRRHVFPLPAGRYEDFDRVLQQPFSYDSNMQIGGVPKYYVGHRARPTLGSERPANIERIRQMLVEEYARAHHVS